MHMRILYMLPSNGVVRNVEELIPKILCISNPMLVMPGLPELTFELVTDSK